MSEKDITCSDVEEAADLRRCRDGKDSNSVHPFSREAAGADSGLETKREVGGTRTHEKDGLPREQAKGNTTDSNTPTTSKARLKIDGRGMQPIDVQGSSDEGEDAAAKRRTHYAENYGGG